MGDNENNDATDDAKRVENETPTTGITSIELVERDSSYPARKLSSGKRKWINLRESVRMTYPFINVESNAAPLDLEKINSVILPWPPNILP